MGEAMDGEPTNELGAGGGREVERLAFFSDAVMAIAMTLLVVELRIPEALTPTATDAELRAALAELGQSFLSVFLSFMVISVWWVGHNRLFRSLAAGDGAIVALNFAFLAAVAFLPFPTRLIGGWVNLPSAVMLYAATNVVAGGSLFAMRWRADRRGLLDVEPALERRRRLAISAVAPLGFAISIPVALVDATLAALSWLLFIPAVVVIRLWFTRAERREAAAAAAVEADGS
jgi:TMEM175 potassium channel family protein